MENLEESLREVCCLGDLEKVKILVRCGVEINSQNKMNGWTGLHWASKRDNLNVVSYLLDNGADPCVLTHKGERALDLTQDKQIKQLLSKNREDTEEDDARVMGNSSTTSKFVPNYMLNPEFPYTESPAEFARRLGVEETLVGTPKSRSGVFSSTENKKLEDISRESKAEQDNMGLVLKFRVAESEEKDFIEIELDRTCLSFAALIDACLTEFNIEKSMLKKIRKLPNTIIRNDQDVKRLEQYQEMEIVLNE